MHTSCARMSVSFVMAVESWMSRRAPCSGAPGAVPTSGGATTGARSAAKAGTTKPNRTQKMKETLIGFSSCHSARGKEYQARRVKTAQGSEFQNDDRLGRER